MATQPPSIPTAMVATSYPVPQHHVPPGPRELRAQAVQRLQAGLFGLAAMLLLIGLANIIMDRARQSDADERAPVTASAAATASNAPVDPLADMGVVPAADPSTPAVGASGN